MMTFSSHARELALSAIRLPASYALGFASVATLYAIFFFVFGLPSSGFLDKILASFTVFAVFSVIGFVTGLPILFAACIILILFHKNINQHLLAWCVMAPPIVVAIYLGYEYIIIHRHNISIPDYLSLGYVTHRAGMALAVSSFTSLIFYRWRPRRRTEL